MRSDLIGTGVEYRAEMLRLDLIKIRGELGLMQTEVARAAGIPAGVLTRYETVEVPLYRTEYLAKLADALGIDLDEYGYAPLPAITSLKSYRNRPRLHKQLPTSGYPYLDFGREMQNARLSSGLTQTAMSKELGVSLTTITSWEIGRQLPTVRNLVKWCRILGTDADAWLARREAEKEHIK